MRRSLHSLLRAPQRSFNPAPPNRRQFLLGAAATAFVTSSGKLVASSLAFFPDRADIPLTIESVELVELHGRYTEEAGVNRQQQVNPLDIYDDLRPAPYTDKPSGRKRSSPRRSTSASGQPGASKASTAQSKRVRRLS